jgi:putative membrane protein
MPSILTMLSPWEFSPTVLVCSVGAGALFWRGIIARRRAGLSTGFWRTASFFIGLVLIYVALQTYVDYLSQHMFWVHRLQHLVLHHLGPLLIVLAVPHEVMAYGLPASLRKRRLVPLWHSAPVRILYGVVQNPIISSVLFVGLIYFWLRPDVHFDAMLSLPLYKLMNWSMAVDGLLFWWLMVDPRPPLAHRTPRFPVRIVMLWAVMLPQIFIGAHIALSKSVLYNVYSVCGRAWPISPLADQALGGLTTWIPAAMMSVIGILLVLRLWMRDSARRGAADIAAPMAAVGAD